LNKGAEPRPRAEVQIEQLAAQALPDGRRVAVRVVITPFQDKPNLELWITNAAGQVVAQTTMLEVITPRLEPTLHIREAQPTGTYLLTAALAYDQDPAQHHKTYSFSVPT
jgi:hypothetical protein